MALAPRPLPSETIDGLRPPRAGFPYFQHAAEMRFEPDATAYSPVNAWWLADASFLVYGDAKFVEEGLRNSPLPDQGYALDWLGTADDNRGMVLSNERAIVVIFRGTRVQVHSLLDAAEVVMFNQSDLRTDSLLLLKPGRTSGRAHAGFANAFAEISDRFDAILQAHLPRQKLWLTGHSLGGGLATLAAAHVGSDRVQGLYTYGAPRAGDTEFAASLPCQSHFRFVHGGDWVPVVPTELIGYRHGGIAQPIPAGRSRKLGGDLIGGFQALSAAATRTVKNLRFRVGDLPFQIAGLADHAPIYYATLLWNALLSANDSGQTELVCGTPPANQ
jgi:triacylglycerol lipase